MSRIPVTLREAEPADAEFLVDLWQASVRRAEPTDQVADLRAIIAAAALSPDQRLLVAEYDGERAGAIFLRLSTVTPINLEPALQVLNPHVDARFRRKGIGRALMEAAVSFAEERGVGHVVTGAESGSRDGNRFLARLAMGQHAVLRVAPTHAVRAKLTAQLPAARRTQGHRPQRVLAVRRSMRRAQSAG